jgi:hypothetical protein
LGEGIGSQSKKFTFISFRVKRRQSGENGYEEYVSEIETSTDRATDNREVPGHKTTKEKLKMAGRCAVCVGWRPS